jgi:hypothetical protein
MSSISDYKIFVTAPAIGILYEINGLLSGQVRLRDRNHGSYPYKYLEMLDNHLGIESNSIEVCGGYHNREGCTTVDINPECDPNFVDDGQTLEKIPDEVFDRWYYYPPYNIKTATGMYNTKLPKNNLLLKAGARAIKPGSLMFLLCSQNYQMHPSNI